MSYKTHLFICTASPDREGKCGHKGSEELRRQLKDRCGKAFGKAVRVNSAGCLGQCEFGIAAVIYPQEKWFLEKTKDDGDELFNAVSAEMEKLKL